MKASLTRISALTLRHWYLLSRSWTRIIELAYWPTMNMIVWGLLNVYFVEHKSSASYVAFSLLAGVILWDILFRGQLGFTFSFLEEVSSRNVANLIMSPLRPWELVASLMLISLIRLLIGMAPVTLLAFLLFNFNIYSLGLALIFMFFNLIITSWSVGLIVTGLILRNGIGAQNFAWSVMMLLLPITCVYYPVSILPSWLQTLAWMLPPTYMFEAMRSLIIDYTLQSELIWTGFFINIFYLGICFLVFLKLLQGARQKGSLLFLGE